MTKALKSRKHTGKIFINPFSICQIRFTQNKSIINKPDVKKSIKIAEKLIKGQGRILVRKSGTESKIRVMGESENKELLKKCVDLISRKIK